MKETKTNPENYTAQETLRMIQYSKHSSVRWNRDFNFRIWFFFLLFSFLRWIFYRIFFFLLFIDYIFNVLIVKKGIEESLIFATVVWQVYFNCFSSISNFLDSFRFWCRLKYWDQIRKMHWFIVLLFLCVPFDKKNLCSIVDLTPISFGRFIGK